MGTAYTINISNGLLAKFGGISEGNYSLNLCIGEFGGWGRFPIVAQPHSMRVQKVLFMSNPFKVFQSVVRFISVLVVNVLCPRRIRNECLSQQSMNIVLNRYPKVGERNHPISNLGDSRLHWLVTPTALV